MHRQLIVKPFYVSRAVLDINTCFGQKVCTKHDIIFALSVKDCAFCSSTTWFLLSSGNLTCLIATIYFVEQNPASMWILLSLVNAQGLHCLIRHLQLIKVDVDPGSKRTFSSICITEEIVPTTAMLVGVRHFLLGNLIGGDSITLPVSWSSLVKGKAKMLWMLLLLPSSWIKLQQFCSCVQSLLLLLYCLGAFPGMKLCTSVETDGTGLMIFTSKLLAKNKEVPSTGAYHHSVLD